VTCWASQFGWMGITNASQWQSAIVVYLLGYISYGVTLVFYASIFPRLARNTQKTKDARAKLDSGEIDTETYETTEMLERNRLSTISTAHSNCTSILPIFNFFPLLFFRYASFPILVPFFCLILPSDSCIAPCRTAN
jgi:MFS-type transporter involved in bile tolerance (Atg22 family)